MNIVSGYACPPIIMTYIATKLPIRINIDEIISDNSLHSFLELITIMGSIIPISSCPSQKANVYIPPLDKIKIS